MPVTIKKVLVKDLHKKRDTSLSSEIFSRLICRRILEDPSIDIIVEVIGGTSEAKQAIESSLRAGKGVVTANKDVMAEYGRELLKLADENKCDLLL